MELNAHQKLGLVVFIVIGMATLTFGTMRMGQSITAPFERDSSLQYRTLAQREDDNERRMKTQDSDGDTLSDYDETYVFRTSPFLADSDSDGIPDNVEIAQGTDPNCPTGRTCREASREAATAASAPGSLTGGGSASQQEVAVSAPTAESIALAITETFGDPQTITPESIAGELARMSTDDLRAFLARLGIPAPALEQADDTTLRALLQETMVEIATKAQ